MCCGSGLRDVRSARCRAAATRDGEGVRLLGSADDGHSSLGVVTGAGATAPRPVVTSARRPLVITDMLGRRCGNLSRMLRDGNRGVNPNVPPTMSVRGVRFGPGPGPGTVLTGVTALVLVATACSSGGPWRVSAEPKLRVDVAAGCPKSVSGYADVFNTYTGSKLVPAGPDGGLICQYHPTGGVASTDAGQLADQSRLNATQANNVAQAIRSLDLRVPTGTYHCPAAIGAFVLIGLSYPSRADVGLWYADSGCKSLNNGRLGSFEGGNPSFYETFEATVMDPSSTPKPPVNATIVTTPPIIYTLPAGQTPTGQSAPRTTVVPTTYG